MATRERTPVDPSAVLTVWSVIGALGGVLVVAFGALHHLWSAGQLGGVAVAYVAYGAVAGRLMTALRATVDVEDGESITE